MGKINFKKAIRILAPIIVTVGIFLFLFSKIELSDLVGIYSASNKLLLLAAACVLLSSHALIALRWKVLLGVAGYDLAFLRLLRIYLSNLPIAKFAPLYSGNFVKAYYLRNTVPPIKGVGVVVTELVFDVFVLATLSLVSGLIAGYGNVAYIAGLLVVGLPLLLLVSRRILKTRWQHLARARGMYLALRGDIPRLILTVGLTILMWFNVLLFIKITFLSYGYGVPLVSILALQPLVIFVALLPISIWGIGTRESAMLLFYGGVAPSSAILLTGLTHSLIGAILMPIVFLPFTYKLINRAARSQGI